MMELSIEQIEKRLDEEFRSGADSGGRKIIFWYDRNGDFKDDIANFSLTNAKILELTPTNQFRSKILLEREDPTSNYLVYAPFEKPRPEENHLEDTYLYSRNFSADRIRLILADLSIPQEYLRVLEKYSVFFRAKDRRDKFYKLGIREYSEEVIEKAIIGILAGNSSPFDDVLRTIVTSPPEKQEKILEEFDKYGISDVFWEYVKSELGYISQKPNLKDFTLSLFASTLKHEIEDEVDEWNNLNRCSPRDARIFLDSLKNNIKFQSEFDRLASEVEEPLNVREILNKLSIDDYYRLDTIPEIELRIIRWIVEQLERENVNEKVKGLTIADLIKLRLSTHFGEKHRETYLMLQAAEELIQRGLTFQPSFETLSEAFEDYTKESYRLDQLYRKFYYHYDQLKDTEAFENLRELVENIYTNRYLEPEIKKWNALLEENGSYYGQPLQRDLYEHKLANTKQKTAVIISDALRYEIAQELFEKLAQNPKYSGSLESIAGMLPSFTRLAMSAMLPHTSLEMSSESDVYLDGKKLISLKQREEQLQTDGTDNVALSSDYIKRTNVHELRDALRGKRLIYVFHNQIDSRGDKPETEDEVFRASEEAIAEIEDLIRKLNSADVSNFFVTADHGFLYVRNKLQELDKISLENRDAKINRRYAISEEPISQEGVISIPMSRTFNNEDSRYLNFPLTQSIFKAPGAGINYVHGGSSPQESVVPWITIKAARKKRAQQDVSIELFGQLRKITNLYSKISFFQKEPVGTDVTPAKYKIYIYSDDEDKIISNTHTFTADSTSSDLNERIFTFDFELANREYDRNRKYFIIAENESGVEVLREEITIDIPLSGAFGSLF